MSRLPSRDTSIDLRRFLLPATVLIVSAALAAGCDGANEADDDSVEDGGMDAARVDAIQDIDAAQEIDAAPGADALADASTGPAAACDGPGGGGHVQIVAAYWASSDAFGDFIAELVPAVQAGHIDVARLDQPLPDGVDVIVDLHWYLFDYTTHTVRADLAAQLDALEVAAGPVLGRVRAFYLIDEPYIGSHLIPRAELETAIAAIEARFPSVPTYITFAHHCFDPDSTDSACQVAGANRGIPAGLDWVGFDWYNTSNDLSVAATHVPTRIAPGVERIAELAPSVQVILVPEGYTDGNRLQSTAVATLYDYFVLAAQSSSVFGVDFFLWPDVPAPENFSGLRSLPAARAAARSFARWVRKECGDPAELVPVTQWYSSAGPDYRYEPWVWDGRSQGYRVDGVAFALPPAGSAGAVPLVHCLVDRGSTVDSYLTLDAACDGVATVAPGVVIGGIFSTQQPGTVQLHRYVQQAAPWDHAYSTSSSAALPGDYSYEFPIGWVYPASAL